jgi:hypothetical protein
MRYHLEDYSDVMGEWFYGLHKVKEDERVHYGIPEGTKIEWQAVYCAIIGNHGAKFHRLAVAPTSHGFRFWSPRNSHNPKKDCFNLMRSEVAVFLELLNARLNGTFVNLRTEDRTEARHGDIAYDCPREIP